MRHRVHPPHLAHLRRDPAREREGVAIPYPGSSLPGVCAIVVAVGSVHKALEMQASTTTKLAKTRAGRATQAHDTTLGARGALLQACPVQKWPGGHTWSRDASVSSAKRMGHSVPTWSPPATVQSSWIISDHSVPTWSPPAKVQSSWIILCQLGALLQVPVSPQHACMFAIVHNPHPARPVAVPWQSPSPATRRPQHVAPHPRPATLRGNLGTCLGTWPEA